jgi:hypothetical protein
MAAPTKKTSQGSWVAIGRKNNIDAAITNGDTKTTNLSSQGNRLENEKREKENEREEDKVRMRS